LQVSEASIQLNCVNLSKTYAERKPTNTALLIAARSLLACTSSSSLHRTARLNAGHLKNE